MDRNSNTKWPNGRNGTTKKGNSKNRNTDEASAFIRQNTKFRRNYNDNDGIVAGPSGLDHNRGKKNSMASGYSANGNQRNEKNANRLAATKPIGLKTLQNVLTIKADAELILKLSSEINGFFLLLEQRNIRSEMMRLILSVMARVSECETEQSPVQLLVHFYMKILPKLKTNANFNRELKLYICDLSTNFAEHSINRMSHIQATQNLLIFLRRLQLTLYQKSFAAVKNLMQLITTQIESINRKGNCLNQFIVDTLAQLNESIEKFDEMREKTEKYEVLLEPPDDFRKISIYPDTFDILSNHELFIRANVVDGKYSGGIDHYLDVQFRLLREDFVRPLRLGITEYVHTKNKAEAIVAAKSRIKDLNVYQNVYVIGSRMLQNEQIHSCKFDITPFKNLRWQYNKRLMTGSLVCLSPDDFKTFFFATIAGQRDPKKLAKGEFQIRLEIESTAMPEITSLITFVMVESQVYFEAYRHNLKVLQEFNKDNFPLAKYIVDVNKNISPPVHVQKNPNYILSNGVPNNDPMEKLSQVDLLGQQEWPPCKDFGFDESQFKAFRAALTKQMVIIQGPPGTGKTYIGLRIVQALLMNSSEWPILIVCYTNHALDQFLEGIMKFCASDELVRIGSKSQCEALQKLNLGYIKSDMKHNRQVPTYIHQGRMESKQQLKIIQEYISSVESEIEDLSGTVLGNELRLVIQQINRSHLDQLDLMSGRSKLNEAILNWLGYQVQEECDQNLNRVNIRSKLNEVLLNWLGIQVQEDCDQNLNGVNNVYDDYHTGVAQEAFDNEIEIDEEDIKEMERARIINDFNSDEEIEHHSPLSPAYDNRKPQQPISLNMIVPIQFEDNDGYKLVKNKRRSVKQQLKREIKKSETMSMEQAADVVDINTLSPNNRWNLYRLWMKLYVQQFQDKIKVLRDQYCNECLRFNSLRNQEDIEVVKKAKIIGMTTTGAAKYRHIIDGAKPKITIVEEAAEVLEAHIVTALSKHTDHLILIGDHLQLRPNPAVYELAKKFNLEVSLFERMLKNQIEYFQLTQQHRMRPCISSLLVPHIYKQLLDHPSVEEYEGIKGITKNMFFINHGQNESSLQDTRSHMNLHEASFIVELCRYLILQGYAPSQVTILTTYSGQLYQIKQLMRGQHLLADVRATVVDNYQGEENDIILLSFVRSNFEGNIGFLKISNRVNVALSRAKKGLYCIGNFDCLAQESSLWRALIQDLTTQNAIGDGLQIYCQNHTEYKSVVKVKEDFEGTPEGGCLRPCASRLPCGHSCTSACHIIDVEHLDVYKKCHKKCDKTVCERDHRCSKLCHFGHECGNCTAMVEKLRIECQHVIQVACSADPSNVHCSKPCEKNRSCGHKCKNICGALCDQKPCYEKVETEAPCGHKVIINCSDAKDNLKLLTACTEPCNIELMCGHLCKGSCGRCIFGRLHVSCQEKCTRTLICGHSCPDRCSTECAPCKKKCSNSCVHSKCSYHCGDPCPPCMEKCTWRCDHLECSKLCSEPCDRKLCDLPSNRTLKKCDHPSIGVCGEEIPHLCRVCDKDKVEEIFFGNEDEEDAKFIELKDCHHIIEVNGLLRWMQSESDTADSNASGNDINSIEFKKCPKCKTIIRHTKALNTFIQESLHDIEQVKLKTCGDPKENETTQRKLHRKVESILENYLFKAKTVHLSHIYADIYHQTKHNDFFARSKQHLMEQTNKFELVEELKKICVAFEKRSNSQYNININAIEKFKERIQIVADFIKSYRNCKQQRNDISAEMSFLEMMKDVIVKASNQPFDETGKKLLNEAFDKANGCGSATKDVREEFAKLVIEAFKYSSGLGITLEEKQMILKTMDFQRGHWFKCPNGHIYCIGECGGAMQRSKCPDCGSVIGGANHLLESSNALATEMDGATTPSWPTNLEEQLRPFMD